MRHCGSLWRCDLVFGHDASAAAGCSILPSNSFNSLYLCNTLFLGKQLYSFYRHRVVLNDFRKLFAGFLPGQFFGVLAGCIIYMALVNYLGYYISSVLYLLLAQFFLKVKPIPAIISCACIMIVTYLVFSMFLHVPLPLGVWFE